MHGSKSYLKNCFLFLGFKTSICGQRRRQSPISRKNLPDGETIYDSVFMIGGANGRVKFCHFSVVRHRKVIQLKMVALQVVLVAKKIFCRCWDPIGISIFLPMETKRSKDF